MKELLEAGVHFGHQVKRWHPKMKKYIFGERNGIYIIDLQKTVKGLEEAYNFVKRRHHVRGARPFCRHKEAIAGRHKGRGTEIGRFLCEPALARRHADKLLSQLRRASKN